MDNASGSDSLHCDNLPGAAAMPRRQLGCELYSDTRDQSMVNFDVKLLSVVIFRLRVCGALDVKKINCSARCDLDHSNPLT